ncbi:MAG: hypothetical protein LBL73_04615 [Synergistaceae bacterium]|jgi:hypothetical protein|nr:hypothetical protein [Synergistaceae bacterium]
MSQASQKRFSRFAVLFASLLLITLFAAGSASAADTHKFPNGASFSCPSGFQKQEISQPPMSTVTLANPSDPSITLAVSFVEGGAPGTTAIPENIDESVYKGSLPEGTELVAYKKTTVGGKDALLIETTVEVQGMYIYSHSVSIISGEDLMSVVGTFMGKDKVDAGKKAVESIESSIKF